ncbi:hypothetical protein ACFL5V_08665 [Fibrobacterota bacterium]
MKTFFIWGLIVIITLCVLEVLLKLFAPIYFTGYVGAYQYDDELGTRLKPNIHFFRTTDYQQEIRTNRLGTVNFQESFKDYKHLVYTIGDSYTQGTGSATDAAYPFQLDIILNTREGHYEPDYGVINLGLASYGGEQAALCLRRYMKEIGRPDFILFFGCPNDNMDNILFRSGYYHSQLVEGSPKWGAFLKPVQWVTNELEIGKRIKIILGKIRRGRIQKDTGKSDAPQNVAKLQEHAFLELKHIADSCGARLIVSWVDANDDPSKAYDWLENWADSNGVSFADWYEKASSVKEHIPALPFENNHSGGHFRTWINYAVARAFADNILPSTEEGP